MVVFKVVLCKMLSVLSFFFFFFSSRRRHTRSDRDWSSDVCSSDLGTASTDRIAPSRKPQVASRGAVLRLTPCGLQLSYRAHVRPDLQSLRLGVEIGRASCRERV